MTKMLRCPACMGQKKVMKLGMTLYDCETCFGVGMVKECDIPEQSKPKIYHPTQILPVEDIDVVKENFPAVYDDDFKPRKGVSNDKKKK